MAAELKKEQMVRLVQQLEKETEVLRRRQKHARHYEYREDREQRLSLADAEAVSQHTERPVTQQTRRGANSRHPRRRKSDGDRGGATGFLPSVSPFHRTTPREAASFAGDDNALFASSPPENAEEQVGLDEYDPEAVAAREEKKLRDRVMALRDESSRVTLELQAVKHSVEEARGKLKQVKAEDEILQIRKRSQQRLAEETKQVGELQADVEREERYHLTLEHMYRCRRDERVERLKAMQAVEEALRVQENERDLQENHVQQVQAAVKAEEGELRRIAAEQRRQQQDLRKKLEAREQEAHLRRRKKLERQRRLREEAALQAKAEGELTEEEQRQLRRELQRAKSEIATLNQAIQVREEQAEQLEANFLRVRVAAGLPQAAESGGSNNSDPQSSKPDPEAVVARYVAMQRDVLTVTSTLQDLQQRLVYLQEARAEHQAALQPRARDETDETGTNRSEIDDLRHRLAIAQREIESAQQEGERLHQLKVSLSQSLEAVHLRCRTIPANDHEPVEDELGRYASDWTRALHSKIIRVSQKLHHVRTAVQAAEERHALASSASPASRTQEGNQWNETMQSMMNMNEYSIRIRSQHEREEPTSLLAAEDVTDAAQQLATARARLLRSGREADADNGDDETLYAFLQGSASDEDGRSSRQYRRESRRMIQAALQAIPSLDSRSLNEKSTLNPSRVRRDNTRRPLRTKELSRYVAAAVSQSGAEVREEYLFGTGDVEEVPSRATLKQEASRLARLRTAADATRQQESSNDAGSD